MVSGTSPAAPSWVGAQGRRESQPSAQSPEPCGGGGRPQLICTLSASDRDASQVRTQHHPPQEGHRGQRVGSQAAWVRGQKGVVGGSGPAETGRGPGMWGVEVGSGRGAPVAGGSKTQRAVAEAGSGAGRCGGGLPSSDPRPPLAQAWVQVPLDEGRRPSRPSPLLEPAPPPSPASQWPPPPRALTPPLAGPPPEPPPAPPMSCCVPTKGVACGGPPAPIPLSLSLLEQGCQGSGRWLG